MVILGLCVSARPWKPIFWSSWQTVLGLTLLPEAVRNSVGSVATENKGFFRTTRFSTRRSHSVSLCGLPLRGWAVVAPRCFHFTISVLIVDWSSSCMAEIWLVGKLASYDGATLKVTEHFSKDLLLPMFVNWICMAVCSIFTPVSNGCDSNSRIH